MDDKKNQTPEAQDLRKGLHGAVMTNSVDAGLPPGVSNIDNSTLASPDPKVPEGQGTHE